ncbi:MAG: MFS transporter, partial [Micromonosporaceae bacterium]
LASAAGRMPVRGFAALLAAAAMAMAVGGHSRSPVGIVGVAAAFCVYQLATVVADVRLQQAITGGHRATIISVAGFGTEVVTLAVFGGYAGLSAYAPHGTVFAWFALPYLLVAAIWAISPAYRR